MLDRITKTAVLEVFRARVKPELLPDVLAAFEGGLVIDTGDDLASAQYVDALAALPAMPAVLADLGVGESPAGVASALEFVLEGLHLTKRLNKDAVGSRASYRARG